MKWKEQEMEVMQNNGSKVLWKSSKRKNRRNRKRSMCDGRWRKVEDEIEGAEG